ncbi:transposase [Streptococcus porcinus]|nr:transposase [Streptococcus porcinus]
MLYPRRPQFLKRKSVRILNLQKHRLKKRPTIINEKLENGDYEIDTVIQTRDKNNCLLTVTDRLSRHEIIHLIPDKFAQSVSDALCSILKQHKILFVTADNGSEFVRLSEIFNHENISHAHPYSSRERVTNENWINDYPKNILLQISG